MREEEF